MVQERDIGKGFGKVYTLFQVGLNKLLEHFDRHKQVLLRGEIISAGRIVNIFTQSPVIDFNNPLLVRPDFIEKFEYKCRVDGQTK